jgi:acyl-CoA thioesterase
MTSTEATRSEAEIAEAVARNMLSNDGHSRRLGIEILGTGPGHSKLRMTVRKDMLNGLSTGHGGATFSLADSAFAFACNSHNAVTVAQSAQIDFLLPVLEGDILVAEAKEQVLEGRTGVYHVAVTNQRSETVACFRGLSRRIRGEIVSSGAPGNNPGKP